MKRVLFFIFSVISLQIVVAQPPSLKTTVNRTQILIGEQLTYNVEVSFPVNAYQVNWFNVPDSFNHFEIVVRGKVDTIEKNGMLTCRQTLTLTSFDSGVNTIPAQAIDLMPVGSDSAIHLFTDSIAVNVSFSPLDSTKTFHDIKTIIEVKDEIPLWIWIAGAALLILLIVALYYLIRYLKKRPKKTMLFTSKLSPYDEAMQQLSMLQKEQLLYKGQVKEFHTKLGDIFKRYVSRKKEKNMLNYTSADILVFLNETLLSKENTSTIAATLRMNDAVKFAKYSPPAAESENALANAKKIIEQIEKLIFTPDSDRDNTRK